MPMSILSYQVVLTLVPSRHHLINEKKAKNPFLLLLFKKIIFLLPFEAPVYYMHVSSSLSIFEIRKLNLIAANSSQLPRSPT